MTELEQEGWRRLHPLSPIVRGGRSSIAALFILFLTVARGSANAGDFVPFAFIAVFVILGFISWLVTRWRIDDDDLRIESGVLRRQSLRFPLSQVQAIDIVRPGLARAFNLAELRLRMGGSSSGSARLAYIPEREVEGLRSQLLALAHGGTAAVGESAPAEPPKPAAQHVVSRVPTGRLIASIALSDVGFYVEAVLVAGIVALLLEPQVAAAVITGGGIFWLVGVVGVTWRRFNTEYNLTVAESAEGLHVDGGLIALTHETIRPGRVQAVRMVEPFLWRPFGWCRLQVDVAGKQKNEGEGQAQRRSLRTVLPVGNRELVELVLDRILPDRPTDLSPPPPRARYKSPIRYRMLGWGGNDHCVVTTSGRLRRTTCWVPLEKVQSVRRVEGPVQRRLNLASVHLDTAGRSVRATLRDRDGEEADRELWRLTDLARAARRGAASAQSS